MDILVKAAQFFLSLSILIILHELGHYLPAKWFKTRVEKFYLFFNPWFSIWKKKIGETEYGIGWLPLGGYVKIAGMIDESMDKEQMKQPAEPWEFRSKPAWQRLIIMVGGVTVNIILGIMIYAATLWYWGEQYLPTSSVKHGIMVDSVGEWMGFRDGDRIISVNGEHVENFNQIPLEILLGGERVEVDRDGQVLEIEINAGHIKSLINSPGFLQPRIPYFVGGFVEGSAAQAAGIMEGDQIVEFNGQQLAFFDQFVDSIPAYKGREIQLSALRDGQEMEFTLAVPEEGKIGVYPKINEGYFELSTTRYNMVQAIPAGWNKAVKTLKNYIRQFKVIFNPDTEAYKSVGGFLTIGSQFPSTWDWQFFWNFTAFLSIMLAFLNILPIPALDGGHVVFVLWEMATGRKPNEKVLEYAQVVGFVILVGLLLLANGNDIIKLFFK